MSIPIVLAKKWYDVEYLDKLSNKIVKEAPGFKKHFNRLEKKYSERALTSISRCRGHDLSLQDVRKQLGIYKRDYKSLKTLVKLGEDKNRRISLELENNEKERYLSQLMKENKRLNKLKYDSFHRRDLVKDIKYSEAEAEILKRLIDKTGKASKVCKALVKNYKEEYLLLMIEYSKLSKFFENEETESKIKKESYELLTNQLNSLKTNKKTLASKCTYKIKELEKELEMTNKKRHTLNMQVFKKAQQKRLIDMSKAEVIIEKHRSKTPIHVKIRHTDVSFMYKPSFKRLYD